MKTFNESTEQSDLISLGAAARRLDISLRGLYRLIARGDLPHPVKVGGSSKFFHSDINQYLETIHAARR